MPHETDEPTPPSESAATSRAETLDSEGQASRDLSSDERTTLDGGPATVASPLPESIGSYEILGLLGEGGMGAVYEALQPSPRRRVAVKVVRGGHRIDDARVRMFEREIETLARLEHPNIGAIYESGHTEDGQHFFAMELVRGRTLAEFLDARGGSTSDAEIRLRLALFRQIADAVHYAHQRGVIHRDLKPSNIIVTESSEHQNGARSGSTSGASLPAIKILDFGLARITEADVAAASMITEVGMIKGTLPYMSPEQTRGNPHDIDLRSDVYALGVILYELLTGERPYDVTERSLVDALRVICEQPPRALSSEGHERFDPDLETIVGKALEKDVDRRYASAAELSADVERYLTSQPIQARPPSTVYQLRKFAGRNRALVGGLAATFLALLLGVVVSTVLGLREAAQRRAAEAAQTDLQTVVDFQARMLADVDATAMGEALMADLRERVLTASERSTLPENPSATADSFAALTKEISPTDVALDLIDRDILARASRAVDVDFADRPRIALELRGTLGETYSRLGMLEEAVTQRSLAYDLSRVQLGEEHRETLQTGRMLADELWRVGRQDEAAQLSTAVVETGRRVLGDDDPEVLRARFLAASFADRQGRTEEAESAYLELLEDQRRIVGPEHSNTLGTLSQLALLYSDVGRGDEGEPLMREALEIAQRTLGPEHVDTLIYLHNLAFIENVLGRYEDSARHFQELLEVRRRVLGGDHPRTLHSKGNLANTYREMGELEPARRLWRELAEDQARVRGEESLDALEARRSLAIIENRLGNYEEAESIYLAVLDAQRRTRGEDDEWTLRTTNSLSTLYSAMGRYDEAELLLQRTIEALERSFGPRDRRTLRSRMNLALLYEETQRYEEAEPLLRETEQAMREEFGDTDVERLFGARNLVQFLILRTGKLDEAETRTVELLETGAATFGEEAPFTLSTRNLLGVLRQFQGRHDAAREVYREVLEVQRRTLKENDPELAITFQNMACNERDDGRYEQAEELFAQADRIFSAHYGPDHRALVDNLQDWLELRQLEQDESGAKALEERIASILSD